MLAAALLRRQAQSEVVRSIVLEDSLCLLHGLWAAAPHAKASVFGRTAAEARGKAVLLSLPPVEGGVRATKIDGM